MAAAQESQWEKPGINIKNQSDSDQSSRNQSLQIISS